VIDAHGEVDDFLRHATWGQSRLNLPLALDIELGGIKRREPAWCRDWWAAAIEHMLAETGEWPMIYTGYWTLRWIFGKGGTPTHTRCPLWWAEYTNGSKPRRSYSAWYPTIWQHTSKGRVAGIKGNVDRNIALRPCSIS
jgi:GH25 family lysozyme M1 (1,4-beta-N-acetylmuramidase)